MREGDPIIFGDNGQVQGVVVEISRTSFTIEIKIAGQIGSNSVMKIPGPRY